MESCSRKRWPFHILWGRERGEWKIEDEALFALARAKLDELANQAEPFALALTEIA